MRGSRISAVLVAAAIWGCQDGTSAPGMPGLPDDPEPERRTPETGGATGDFSGRCHCESTTRELGLSETDEVLGFSATDALEKIEGDYALAMVWGDACEGEDPQTDGCSSEAPDFTGSETEVLVGVDRAATTARVDECKEPDGGAPCHITWLVVPVAGTLATSDGLLDEAFEAEVRVRSLDEVGVGQTFGYAELEGALPSRMPGLSRVAWGFGVTEADAWFEVSAIAGSRTRVWGQPPDGGRTLSGHSWGVAVDLEEARR